MQAVSRISNVDECKKRPSCKQHRATAADTNHINTVGSTNEPSRVMMGFGLFALLLSTISSTIVEPTTYTTAQQRHAGQSSASASSSPPPRHGGAAPAYPTNDHAPYVEQFGRSSTPPGNGGGTPPEFLEDAFYDAYYNFIFPNQETCPAYLTELEHSLMLRRGRRRVRRVNEDDDEEDTDVVNDGSSSSDDEASPSLVGRSAIAAVCRLACVRQHHHVGSTQEDAHDVASLSSNDHAERNCETGSRSSRDGEEGSTDATLNLSLSSVEVLTRLQGATTPSSTIEDEDVCTIEDLVALVLYNPMRATHVVQQVVLASALLPRCAAVTQALLRMALPMPGAPSSTSDDAPAVASGLYGAVVCIPLGATRSAGSSAMFTAETVVEGRRRSNPASPRRAAVASHTPTSNDGCSVLRTDASTTSAVTGDGDHHHTISLHHTHAPICTESGEEVLSSDPPVHRLFLGQLRKDTTTDFVEHLLSLMGIDVARDIVHIEMHTTSQGARAKGCAWVDARGDAVRDRVLAFHKRIFLNDATMFHPVVEAGGDVVVGGADQHVCRNASAPQCNKEQARRWEDASGAAAATGGDGDGEEEFLVVVDSEHVGVLEQWTSVWKDHPNRCNEKLSRGAIVIEVPAKPPKRNNTAIGKERGGGSKHPNANQKGRQVTKSVVNDGASCNHGGVDAMVVNHHMDRPAAAAAAAAAGSATTTNHPAAAYFSGLQGCVPFLLQQRSSSSSSSLHRATAAPASTVSATSAFDIGGHHHEEGGSAVVLTDCPAWRYNPYDALNARTYVVTQ